MDEFELVFRVNLYGSGVHTRPVGNLSLTTSKLRKYELPFPDCTSAETVYSFLHTVLHEHRPAGQRAMHYYSNQDEATVWRWIKALADSPWVDPTSLGSIVRGIQNSLSVRPTDRQVCEHEWVSLRLA
jgi:hypothetical protein